MEGRDKIMMNTAIACSEPRSKSTSRTRVCSSDRRPAPQTGGHLLGGAGRLTGSRAQRTAATKHHWPLCLEQHLARYRARPTARLSHTSRYAVQHAGHHHCRVGAPAVAVRCCEHAFPSGALLNSGSVYQPCAAFKHLYPTLGIAHDQHGLAVSSNTHVLQRFIRQGSSHLANDPPVCI